MTLKAARELQREIHSYGYHCTVPLGRGPDDYAPRIFQAFGAFVEFRDRAAFRKHHAMRLRERRRSEREYEASLRQRIRPPRNGLEILIDRACGLA